MNRTDFSLFFHALWGFPPRAWQIRLLDELLENGRWPTHITAPTGAGKSAVVDVHVFATALAATGAGPRVPRRLVVCVNRRAIVDQHEQRAHEIAERLSKAEGGVLGEVAEALRGLVTRRDDDAAQSPLVVLSLRGGAPIDREWIHDPSACTVIAATPDMWGSRVLFSGYGTRRQARPREAGLLAMDSVMVLDEAHLNRQLAVLAGDLAVMTEGSAQTLGVPGFQFALTTATPSESSPASGSAGQTVGVEEDDLEADSRLRAALTRPKPVRYVVAPKQPPRKVSDAYVKVIADLAGDVREEASPAEGAARTVGVIVNRVDTAQRVARQLAARHGDAAVVCWVGRMRPMDFDRLGEEMPGLFTVRGDDRVMFCVATQTVEVGVDLDFAGLVTELAPGSALAQRAGRVNRRGLRERAEVVIVGPRDDEIGDLLPYGGVDLRASRTWLGVLAGTQQGLAPWNLRAAERIPPVPAVPRAALTHLELGDAEMLAETSKVAFDEPELAFWLRDSLEPDDEPVNIVMRRGLPEDSSVAMALLKKTEPVAEEMFPASIGDARAVVEFALGQGHERAFVWDADGLSIVDAQTRVAPGMTVVIDAARLTTSGVLSPTNPLDGSVPRCLWEAVRGDAIPAEGPVVLVRGMADELLNQFIGVGGDELVEVATALVGRTVQPFLGPPDADGDPVWVVLKTPDAVTDDAVLRQEWSPSTAVTLADHSEAVASRCRQVGEAVAVASRWARALQEAGRLHDEGKRDLRFQRQTLGNTGDDPLAKSGQRAAQGYQQRRRAADLPSGWRHEQVSACIAWCESGLAERDVVTRLVGTSHGHGRTFFPHAAAQLLPAAGGDREVYTAAVREAANELFTTHAGWDDVIRSTDAALGLWGAAYLEALLRAADCMVSKEGS